MSEPLDFPSAAAADDDPDVVAGMEHLRIVRADEVNVVEFPGR